MKVLELFYEIKDDLQLVEKELQKVVCTPDPLLSKTSAHLLNAGGKRIRPSFALLAGKFYKYDLTKLLPLAVALELIHMASLVHDDVVDASMTRRGIPTVKAQWGNQVSMYTGDYVFAQSLIIIGSMGNETVSRILSDVSVKMCEGEIQQIVTRFDAAQGVKDYFYRIKRKTALLISASCALGAAATGAPPAISRALSLYGHYIGMAFQITDDILDMTANQKELGKPIGGDLRQGIVTLPVIYALQDSPEKERLAEIVTIREKGEDLILEAIDIVRRSGAIEKALALSEKYLVKAKKQLHLLPDVRTKQTFKIIADSLNKRKF